MRTRRSRSSGDPVPSIPVGEGHRSVLLHESIEALQLQKGDTVIDATLGGAGHAREIAARLGAEGSLIGFDADSEAVQRAEDILPKDGPRLTLVNANFRRIAEELSVRGFTSVDKALFDLGWSSYQLSAGRGFSFLTEESLLMTYADGEEGLTAAEVVNEWGEESLADIIFGWGEERYARRIAAKIVEARKAKRIETAAELAEIVKSAVPAAYRRGKLHPATKTFQAIRIAVNDELGALTDGLESVWKLLTPGGRIAVITFHSIEDRIVKRMFMQWEKADEGRRLTKKPIAPGIEEVRSNPRSRSAKLRVIEKNPSL